MNRIYMCIDLKSFYASVECVERGLDPLKTNLVVADSDRTEKTICLAVSPSLKSFGLPGRARLFEVVQKIKEINKERRKKAHNYMFTGSSYNIDELNKNFNLELDYIVAKPRMAYYIKYSTKIYNVYLKYISKDDIYVYSIDEVFCDITNYLKYNKMSAEQLVSKMINDVYKITGITATGGIGTNLYLAKVAMDIVAKHMKPNKYGIRLAKLDEMAYRKWLWNYRPLTSFWRVGKGYAKKLEENNMYTMGDIARCSIEDEDKLYRLFGKNAELLIDHAWGYEPCTIKDIKEYKPKNNSISIGQVLHCSYNYRDTKVIVKEMADSLSLSLVARNLVTNQLVLTLFYDSDSLDEDYFGETQIDAYGRLVPKQAHGTINIDHLTSSSKVIMKYTIELYERIINKNLLVKKINIVAANVLVYENIDELKTYKQFSIFDNNQEINNRNSLEKELEKEENKLQHVVLDIKNKYGKNAILKGINLDKASTMKDRNRQIGGHHE